MALKVLYELLITIYEQFLIFSQTWNLTLHKNTSKDQLKSNQPLQKLNFSQKKSNLPKVWFSKIKEDKSSSVFLKTQLWFPIFA